MTNKKVLRVFDQDDVEECEDLLADVSVVDVDGEEGVADVDVLADAVVAESLRRRALVQDVVRQVADDLQCVDYHRLGWFNTTAFINTLVMSIPFVSLSTEKLSEHGRK